VDDDPLGVAGGHGVDGGLHRLELLVGPNDQRLLRLDLVRQQGPVHDVVAFLGELRLAERAAGRPRDEHRRGGDQEGEEARPGHRSRSSSSSSVLDMMIARAISATIA